VKHQPKLIAVVAAGIAAFGPSMVLAQGIGYGITTAGNVEAAVRAMRDSVPPVIAKDCPAGYHWASSAGPGSVVTCQATPPAPPADAGDSYTYTPVTTPQIDTPVVYTPPPIGDVVYTPPQTQTTDDSPVTIYTPPPVVIDPLQPQTDTPVVYNPPTVPVVTYTPPPAPPWDSMQGQPGDMAWWTAYDSPLGSNDADAAGAAADSM
jgi:hypothetical protein